jgi:hypothetical protein
LAGVVGAKVHRVSVRAELTITIERGDDEHVPPLRSWGGRATATDRVGDLFLDGVYDLTLPTGQMGRAYVSTSIELGVGERRLALDVQGVGEVPWWPSPTPSS